MQVLLDSPGLWVEDVLAEPLVVGCWLRCQGASRVRCLWVEPEQVSVSLRWASQELTELRRLEPGLTPLALRAWGVVWAQTEQELVVLLQVVLARPLQGCSVGSPAFAVLLDGRRAAARFEAEVPLVVKVQRVLAMALLPQEPPVCWAWAVLLG